jgi:hypothetical protein
MATWVKFNKARELPRIMQVYRKIDAFRDAVEAEVLGSAVWARAANGAPASGDLAWQVDVTTIPGVSALTSSGRLA